MVTERKWKAKVGRHLIMKDEEKVLERCLSSQLGCWDEGCLVIVDTGSTDRSIEIAEKYGAKVFKFEWCDDFGKARNFALDKLLECCPDIDYIDWCDCDDILMDKEDVIKYRKILDQYLDNPNIIGLNFPYIYSHESTGTGEIPQFKYHRLRAFKKGTGRWKCRIHEYIDSDKTKNIALHEVVFHHYRDEGRGTMNTARNLRILRKVVDESTPEERPRTLFYYGKECTYNGLFDDAIKAFEEYIPLSNWIPEKHRAMYELAECYRRKKEYDRARDYAFMAIALDKRYADPWIYLTKDAYEAKDYKMAIAYSMMVPQLENPKTLFFDYIPYNTYVPYDYAQACYYYIGDVKNAQLALDKCLYYKPHERRYLTNWAKFHEDEIKGRVGIIIPTLNRKERLINCINKIKENAIISDYDIFIGVDGNEPYFNELNEHFKDEKNMTIVLFEEKVGVPTIVESLIDVAKNCKYITYLGDDTEPLIGFLIYALQACEGKNLVSYNDRVWKGEIACHWFAPRDLREKLGGFFFYKGYNHVGCDNELTEKAKAKNLYKFAEKAYVDHIHYIKNICSDKKRVVEIDDCYKLAWDEEKREKDRRLLELRKKNNFIADTEEIKINIGSGYKNRQGYITLDKFSKADIKADILADNVFLPETVDKILAEHLLEHFSSADGEKFLKICYDALKKGGEIEISTPDVSRLDEVKDEDYKLKVMYGWRTRGEGMFHLFGYTEKNLRNLFELSKFSVLSINNEWNYDAPAIRIVGKK